MKKVRFAQPFILLFYTLISHSFIYAQNNLSDKLPVDPNVKIGKLSNGLTYYIRKNVKPEKKVELRLVVNAGSILEDKDQQGLAHFNEHMAFNGTTHFKKNELVSYLQSLGIEFGADLNAYTSFDETVYILPVPLSDTANLRKGFTVLQDWAQGFSFDKDQIDGERGVVLEESRLGKGAEDRMFRKIYPLQYEGSKYAERLPIGKDSILKNFKYPSLKRFYQQWYRPNLMAVIAVGDIDVAQTEKLIRQYFGILKNPEVMPKRVLASVPLRKENKSIVVTDNEARNFVVQISYPFLPSYPDTTIANYKNSLTKDLFVGLLNQRLSELTQSANPPFLGASVSFSSYARGYEAFEGYCVSGKSGPDSALIVLLHEIKRAIQFGFTEAELERAKKRVMASMERTYNNLDKTESSQFVDEYVRNFLEKESIPGIAKEYEYHQQLLPIISLKEVNAVVNELKANDKILVSLQGPSKSDFTLPNDKDLLALAEKSLHDEVKPYEEKAVATSLIKNQPIPGKIISETKNDQLGTTEFVLSNGVKVVIKSTDFKNDEIVFNSFRKGGLAAYGVADKFSATYAVSAVTQMGVGDFSPTDLKKFMAGKIANVSPRITGLTSGFSGNSSVKDVETLFQLIYLYSTQPRLDKTLFDGWVQKNKSAVQFILSDPQAAFVDTFYNVLYQNNPLAPVAVPKADYFDKINLDRSLAIYKEQIQNAIGETFIFAGSIDINKLKPLIELYIASLPVSGKPSDFIDNGLRTVKGVQYIKANKGKEAKSLILNYYSGEVPYSDELALKAEALSEILNIRIIENLREKMGGIYGGGIFGAVNKVPYNNYSFFLQLPCGPENVEKLQIAAAAEIDTIKMQGPLQKDLDKVKKTWLEKNKVSMKQNVFWLGKLQGVYLMGDKPSGIFDYEKNVNALTVDDIKQTANLLLNGKNIVKGELYPKK